MAGDDPQQRRLAGAVRPDQAGSLAITELKSCRIEDPRVTEVLNDRVHRKHRNRMVANHRLPSRVYSLSGSPAVVRIEPFLLDEERLLGSCGTGRGIVCATDLRLLRVERMPFGRRVRDLSYGEVTSVAIGDEVRLATILAGLALVAIGLVLSRAGAWLGALLDPSHPLRIAVDGMQSVSIVGVAVVAAGAATLGFGLVRRRAYVALHGPALLRQRAHRAAWRFATPTPSDARVFSLLVRQRLAERSSVTEKKVLPFDTV